MKLSYLPFLIIVLLTSYETNAQKQYPQNYFRSPVDIPIHLSANFGELRPNHFHSGIDIRTQGRIKKNIYAIADGYVSRISVSPYGYGKAMYITHPNGYVSVYAHLNRFLGETATYTKNIQYKTKRFEINTYLSKNKIKVKKGDIIALSGNSGSSGGPHLHFEIRDAVSEATINPMLFNFAIKDNLSPLIQGVYIYPTDEKATINEQNETKTVAVSGSNGNYKANTSSIQVNGNIAFGIRVRDMINNSSFKFGVYSIELRVDNKTVYLHTLEQFYFNESLYINSLMDYAQYKTNSIKIQRCFVEPNNKLTIYNHVLNKGVVAFDDDKNHQVKMIVKDVYNNSSELNFNIKSCSKNKLAAKPKEGSLMSYKKANSFETKGINISIPKGALYNDFWLEHQILPATKKTYSPIYLIHNKNTPLHKNMDVEIKATKLPLHLQNKALICRMQSNGKLSAVGGFYNDGVVCTSSRYFGSFTIGVDTVAPKIQAINISNKQITNDVKILKFKITDNLSGIKYYHGFINDQWVLFEYDAKKDLLFHELDEKYKGTIHLKLKVADSKNNIAIFTTTINGL